MNIKENLGCKIKLYRKLRGISQEELAEKLDISQQTLSKIECGKSFLTSDTLEKISTVLNVNVYELFMFEECTSTNATIEEIEVYLNLLKSNPQKLSCVRKIIKEITIL